MFKKLFALIGLVVLVLAGVVLYRTVTFTPPALPTQQASSYPVDGNAAAQRLSQAVQFQTVSVQPPAVADPAPFEGFIAWLEATYPEAHAALRREKLGGGTLLFTWAGRDPAARPVLLTGHYDVVPVIPGTEKDWQHPPFSGAIADGYVWGRGTLDDKGAIVTMMDAVTFLLKQGFQPKQTVYLSFGHDEEVSGEQGAAAVAAYLKSRNVRLAWSLDEGSFVLDGIVPGISMPAASINIGEKGYLTLELTAKGAGGHSSMPPRETAVGILASALVKLQSAPVPGGLDGVAGESFGTLARHMSFGMRLLFANQWLFGPLIESQMGKAASTNAMLRTTTAPTMLSGSVKENVLPIEAVGVVNFRLHPRDTVDSVIAYVKKTVDDERVGISVRGTASNASPLAGIDTPAFRAMADAVRRNYGEVVVAPGLTIAATDSKHYGLVSDNAYRFNPMKITPQDLTGFHGTNERLSVDNLVRATRFYIDLLQITGS
jgi:carboxypeptidase PM20D1